MRESFSAQRHVALDSPPLCFGERVNMTVGRLSTGTRDSASPGGMSVEILDMALP